MGSQRVGHDLVTKQQPQQYSIVYMYHIFFIHSPVDEYFDCFHALAIVNSAAVSIRVYTSFQITVFSEYMPRNEIAGSYGETPILWPPDAKS